MEELLSAAVVAEREQGLTPARIQEFTGSRTWNEAVLRWARDGRCNRSGMPGPALAKSLDAWAADKTPGTPRLVTDGLDATRFPGSAQYEAHQRTRAEHLHTALAKVIQERAQAWDDLNALADDDADAGVDHPVNVRVVAVCRNLAEIYRDLALAESAFSHEYEAEASTFTRAADRFAEYGPPGYPAEQNRR
ncbi:hypothetical protein [Streptomyces sp. NPDC058664]|uniref:hypothetical protein n=1 Tax=unclassified Streptomyces TaxID=2593676 RepID=UPI003654FCCB